ncbi:hypothetical protein FCE95_07985 [Luteimonas gilva]|uniref:DUF378 domain-containing protein n=1 Tax=Luteimonas gilva TaxID=2572684 RepID=A0A4U5JLN1_9GAMM|nr:hypothetical protein [Luteimonas gilva]TKR30075.1 hypothetical protein FCE95_07985 [Luteimonas gilva]
MKSIGGLMLLLGLGSFVLHFMNMEFKLLSWVDHWGADVGVGIRIALVVVGGILWFLGNKREKAVPAS